MASVGLSRLTDGTIQPITWRRRKLKRQVTGKFGTNAAQYLNRHVESGRLIKPNRGLYKVPEPSESQVSSTDENDTGLLSLSEVSETGGGLP